MRHRLSNRKLNRTSSHRLAMLRNMANSLLRHEVIVTTVPKAKELRRVAEPLITLGKKPSLANRRLAFDRTRDREVVGKLFNELGPRYATRPGGYVRILHYGFSNTPAWYVARVATLAQAHGLPMPIGLQYQYSLLDRGVELDIVPAGNALGLGLMPWSPLGGGLLTGKYGRDKLAEASRTAANTSSG